MSRKPAQLEMSGGKSPRQRVWEQIRKVRDSFTQADLADNSKVSISIVKDYVKPLIKAGFIAVVSEESVGTLCKRSTYQLLIDNGLEAPRLGKDGKAITQGSGTENMWGTMRRMFKTTSFNYRELAAFSSTQTSAVTEGAAKAYIVSLFAAGYLECLQEGKNGKQASLARYRLKPAMDHGRRPPMVQKTKRVFDQNLNKVIWTEEPEINDEQ